MKAFALMSSSCPTDNDVVAVLVAESLDDALKQLQCTTVDELNSSSGLLRYLRPSKDHKLSLKEVPIVNNAIYPVYR